MFFIFDRDFFFGTDLKLFFFFFPPSLKLNYNIAHLYRFVNSFFQKNLKKIIYFEIS